MVYKEPMISEKQLLITVFFVSVLTTLLCPRYIAQAAPITCPSPLIYFLAQNQASIGVFDPSVPLSATNPSNTNIPVPGGSTAITLMPNLNGGLSPTFYITLNGTYQYWNGSSWVNTGQNATSGNIGGCANGIYNLGVNIVTYYNGLNETNLLTSLGSQSLGIADLVTDCECNFYSFCAAAPQQLVKYSPNGTILATWPITGIPLTVGGPGFAIIGNQIYCFLGPMGGPYTIYTGTMGGPSITMSVLGISNTGFGNLYDIASCPFVMPGQLTGTITAGTLSCNGQTTNISVTTTNSPVNFSWSGPGILGSTSNSVITVNTAGTYSCVLSGSSNCLQSSVVFTANVSGLGACITVSSTSISCANPGSATVQAVGGAGPFNYIWMPSGQTGSVATGLVPGTYTLTATDQNNGYTFSTTATFSNALATFTGNLIFSPSVTCNGAATGTAAYTGISGGSPNQNYFWTNGSTTLTGPYLTTLSAGSWTVTVTDGITGCTFNQQFIVTQPPAVSPAIAANYPGACINTPIVLTASAMGGAPSSISPGYSFNWTAGPVNNNYTVTQNSAGVYIYTVTATDANNCSGSGTIAVTFSDYPLLSLSNTSICAQDTGIITVTGASSFTWNNGATGNVFSDSPLTSQQYTVMGESGGCISSSTAYIVVIPRPVPVITTNSFTCEGNTLTFNVSGGVTCLWSGPDSFISTSPTNTLNNVTLSAAGIYSVTVTAASSCSENAEVTLSVNPVPSLTIHPDPAVICNGNTIPLTAVSNATSFIWAPLTGLNSATLQSVLAGPTTLQVYTVVASLNTCTNAAVVSVSVLAQPVAGIINETPTVCLNEGIIMRGTGGGSYQWKNPGNILISTSSALNIQAFSNAYNGIYTLQVTNTFGCSDTETTTVVLKPLPSGYLQTNSFSGCIPFCPDFKFIATNTVAVTAHNWNIGQTTFQQTNFSHCFADPGTYTINGKISGINGCANTFSWAVTAYPKPTADFNFSPKHPIENTDAVIFSNTSIGPDLKSFNWYFTDNKGYKSSSENTSFIFENAGIYPVALVIKDARGCSDTIVKPVIVEPDFIFYAPNAFTPNNDQKNDVFLPLTRGIKSYSLFVFDRWGSPLFESNDPALGWDGTYRGEICQDGVYAWKAKVITSNGSSKNFTGFVMILK